MVTKICVFGLGESGYAAATDLVQAGAEVYTYDPSDAPSPPMTRRASHPALAAALADVIFGFVPGENAKLAMLQALDVFRSDAVYADFSAASPTTKRELAELATRREIKFADVLASEPVFRVGLGSALSVAGPGSRKLIDRMEPLGFRLTQTDGSVGGLAARAKLRQAAVAGIGAVLIEVLEAADAASEEDSVLLQKELEAELATSDGGWLSDLVDVVKADQLNRSQAAADAVVILREMGVSSTMAAAAASALRPPHT